MSIDSKIKAIVEKAYKDAVTAANIAIDETHNEAIKMYDSFIDQYYSYRTKSYVRHEQLRPGTGMGINLYRGNQIVKNNGDDPYLDIEFDASDMAGYPRIGANFVLEAVMTGYRGLPYGNWTEWSGEYKGKYFSHSGTPQEAFDEFELQFDNIASGIFTKEIRKLGWNFNR